MTRCVIQPATVRDLSFIAANMREGDRREIGCQFPYWSPEWLAATCYCSEHKWVASWDGLPVAAFGFAHLTAVVVQGWSWGSVHYPKAVRGMFRFIPQAEAELRDAGVKRIEVRALKGYADAARLIARMGGRARATLRNHGTDGETFILWDKVL